MIEQLLLHFVTGFHKDGHRFLPYLLEAQQNDSGFQLPSEEEIFGNCSDVAPYDMSDFTGYSLIPAAVFIMIMGFLYKRKYLFLDVLSGRPGIPYAINMMETTNRTAMIFSFLIATYFLQGLIFGGVDLRYVHGSPPYLKAVTIMLICIYYSSQYLPIFVGITTKHPLGYFLAMVFAWFLTLTYTLVHSICWTATDILSFLLSFGSNITPFIFSFVLSIYLTVNSVLYIRQRFKRAMKSSLKVTNVEKTQEIEYVRALFRKPQADIGQRNFVIRILRIMYTNTPGFRYSVGILSAVVVSMVVVFEVALGLLYNGYAMIYYVRFILEYQLGYINKANNRVENMTDVVGSVKDIFDILIHYAFILRMVMYASFALSLLLSWATLVATLKSYRKHKLNIARGVYKGIPRFGSRSARALLASSCRFVGYQIGYSVWGFIIALVVIFVILTFLTFAVVVSLQFNLTFFIFKLFYSYVVPTLALSLAISLGQNGIVYFFFTTRIEGYKTRVFQINNRKMFFNYQYYMIFINAAIGLISALKRLLLSIVFGVWAIGSLDQSTLPRRYEKFDAGFSAFISMLKLEHTHTNPVMLASLQVLYSAAKQNASSLNGYAAGTTKLLQPLFMVLPRIRRRQVARNKWHLAVMLIRNPSLLKYRQDDEEVDKVLNNDSIPI